MVTMEAGSQLEQQTWYDALMGEIRVVGRKFSIL